MIVRGIIFSLLKNKKKSLTLAKEEETINLLTVSILVNSGNKIVFTWY